MPPDQGQQLAPLATYQTNLRALVRNLRTTGATLIFATTTPVPPNSVGRVAVSEHDNNKAAIAIMHQSSVAIDDLHRFVAARVRDLQLPQNVHFTPEGSMELATHVAASIRAALPEKSLHSRSRP